MNTLRQQLKNSVDDAVRVIDTLKREENLLFIEQATQLIASCFSQGNKVLVAGNGGSLCDAVHFAEELTGAPVSSSAK